MCRSAVTPPVLPEERRAIWPCAGELRSIRGRVPQCPRARARWIGALHMRETNETTIAAFFGVGKAHGRLGQLYLSAAHDRGRCAAQKLVAGVRSGIWRNRYIPTIRAERRVSDAAAKKGAFHHRG